MIKIMTFRPEHLRQLVLRKEQEGERPKVVALPAVSMFFDEQMLGIFGGYLMWPGVMQVWGLVDEGAGKRPKVFHKAMCDFVQKIERTYKCHRMQMSVKCGFIAASHWAESLGFKREGYMRAYSSKKEAHWLFARTTL